MVSYKDKYLEVKKQLKALESNCIDLRNHQDSDHPIIFDEKKWQIIYDTIDKKIMMTKK